MNDLGDLSFNLIDTNFLISIIRKGIKEIPIIFNQEFTSIAWL
jgi:hypothetical protein